MEQVFQLPHIVAAVVYSVLGFVMLVAAFFVVDLISPGNLWKDIVKDKNTALAVLVGSTIISLGIIIASAIHG